MTVTPDTVTAKPFAKWVGGKRGIMSELVQRLPSSFDDYYEPFVGGGALFFERRAYMTGEIYLSDNNFSLMMTYKAIQDHVELLLERLTDHAQQHCKAYYYEVRSWHDLEDPIDVAARFIYLNRTCYNGLWRVNSKGEFNVPLGSYVNPKIVHEETLRTCHEALQGVKIQFQEFDKITPQAGDFVYFDPPYHPTDPTAFTQYVQSGFTEKDQERLRDTAVKLHQTGVLVMLSNSNTPYICDLYKSKRFKIEVISAPALCQLQTQWTRTCG